MFKVVQHRQEGKHSGCERDARGLRRLIYTTDLLYFSSLQLQSERKNIEEKLVSLEIFFGRIDRKNRNLTLDFF